MKVAVSAEGGGLDSTVDARFGRAANFIIVDTDTMEFECISNDAAAAAGGAGINAAKLIADSGAKAVLTGNCGPNAERALTAAGVKIYANVSGTIRDTVEAFKNGKLASTDGPTVNSHFGTGA